MNTASLILEIGTEEIPASQLQDGARQLADLMCEALSSERLSTGRRTVWFTPRRLIVGLDSIPLRQEDVTEIVMGPPKSVAYDANGPTRAAQAFAEKMGVAVEKLTLVTKPKGEYVSATRRTRGEKTATVLKRIIPEVIPRIHFPKSMYWTESRFRFSRPIRWIVALYENRVVRFRVADIRSSNVTAGHRFLGKSRLRVDSIDTLQEVLRQNGVVVDPAERLEIIEEGLRDSIQRVGGTLVDDRALKGLVTNLNENPSVILGNFDPSFLKLPDEILITVMREHQKYFSVRESSGALMPYFLAVINLPPDRAGGVRRGHERVLGARLSDATFFWKMDRKAPLGNRLDELKGVLFQEKLGSYHDKTERILLLLPKLAERVGATDHLPDLEAAGRLCKCDLVTEMVQEFPNLQGIVGGLYAKADGLSENTWRAVYDHYLPRSMSSPCPSTRTGAILALVDRLDTVTGCFSVGLIPSGSKDPFAVRRQGNAVLKIVLDHQLRISLAETILWSLQLHRDLEEKLMEQLMSFFEGRLRFFLDESGFANDCINAALAVGFDDPVETWQRVRSLQQMRTESEFLALSSNFKRVMNILSQAETVIQKPSEELLSHPSEQLLWELYLELKPKVDELRRGSQYLEALRTMATMRPTIDRFFDDVLVMDEDSNVRLNRLAILNELAEMFLTVADISHIVPERSST